MNIKIIETQERNLTVNVGDFIQLQIEQQGDESFIDLDPRETKKLIESLKDIIPELYNSGIDIIAKQRKEQLNDHNISVEDDIACNTNNQLAIAATYLATPDWLGCKNVDAPQNWDEEKFDYMMNKDYVERLEIAGALIAAEIDRLNASE
jgi:hypothetical protein